MQAGSEVRPARAAQALAQLYGLYATRNAEIRSAFYKLCVPAEDASVLGPCVDLLKTQVGAAR
jgi:leukotriene-A4 hydrolase